MTLLWDAAYGGDLYTVETLIAKGVNVDDADEDGWTALYAGCCRGHLDVVKCLLDKGKADINKANDRGSTPLYIAAVEGHLDIVKLLIKDYNADVNKANKLGVTPLYVAAYKGRLDVLKFLIKEGNADVNKSDHNGWTPLYSASVPIWSYSVGVLVFGVSLMISRKLLVRHAFGTF